MSKVQSVGAPLLFGRKLLSGILCLSSSTKLGPSFTWLNFSADESNDVVCRPRFPGCVNGHFHISVWHVIKETKTTINSVSYYNYQVFFFFYMQTFKLVAGRQIVRKSCLLYKMLVVVAHTRIEFASYSFKNVKTSNSLNLNYIGHTKSCKLELLHQHY